MTEISMALLELLRKHGLDNDVDFLREGIRLLSQQIMELQGSEQVGAVSLSPYIIVEHADSHYARAVAMGAEIVIEIRDEDYGGRGYTCRDPEGHVWSFGSYDPWASA